MSAQDTTRINLLCRVIRRDIVKATTVAKSGHLSSSLSAVELMATLFFDAHLRYDTKDPLYIGNDRVIFSKGHASPLLYALWRAAGVISEKELLTFRSIESPLEGHPTSRFPFADASTGSLGQGLSIGMGMAMYSQRYLSESFHTYVLLGDSELSEGSNWEAIQSAPYNEVKNLTAIVDVNRLGQRGETMLGYDLENYAQRFSSFGWKTIVLSDGHSLRDISHAYTQARLAAKPVVILAKTVKGKGISFIEDRDGWHGVPLKEDQARRALAEIDAPNEALGTIATPPKNVKFIVRSRKAAFRITVPPRDAAPRSMYGMTANQLFRTTPSLVALDAEVSNSTYAYPIAHTYPDRFFEMFIAEQHMVSMAVGLALRNMHPLVSTFASFLTRAHDQIRMARYNNVAITFIGIHAGVSIGQDGVSQMGLEDLAMMRSIPDAVIFYPSDAVAAQKSHKASKRV
ncbi:MAG: Transketolase [Microgenomates bacterium OLB22]|nr:MAG: Transketolase [Microgenomates bacterium OLB22]